LQVAKVEDRRGRIGWELRHDLLETVIAAGSRASNERASQIQLGNEEREDGI
jgi:hypothetical protein